MAFITSKKLESIFSFKLLWVLWMAVTFQPLQHAYVRIEKFYSVILLVCCNSYKEFFSYNKIQGGKAVVKIRCLQCTHNIRHFCDIINKVIITNRALDRLHKCLPIVNFVSKHWYHWYINGKNFLPLVTFCLER